MKTIKNYILETKQNFLIKGHTKDQTKSTWKSKKSGFVKDINDLDPGDILCTEIGWNSRRVEFWQVEKIKGKTSVEVRNIDAKLVSGAYNTQGKVVPNMNCISQSITVGKFSSAKHQLKIDKKNVWFWSGEPEDVYSD